HVVVTGIAGVVGGGDAGTAAAGKGMVGLAVETSGCGAGTVAVVHWSYQHEGRVYQGCAGLVGAAVRGAAEQVVRLVGGGCGTGDSCQRSGKAASAFKVWVVAGFAPRGDEVGIGG